MAESLLTLLSSNSWTDRYSIVTKRRLHWILQVIGCGAILAGTIIEIYLKEAAGRKHFRSDHAITGKPRSVRVPPGPPDLLSYQVFPCVFRSE